MESFKVRRGCLSQPVISQGLPSEREQRSAPSTSPATALGSPSLDWEPRAWVRKGVQGVKSTFAVITAPKGWPGVHEIDALSLGAGAGHSHRTMTFCSGQTNSAHRALSLHTTLPDTHYEHFHMHSKVERFNRPPGLYH